MPNRPSDEINTAVLDAILMLEVAGDGSVSREALEQAAVRREAFAAPALSRYQQDHPAEYMTEGEIYNAIEEGLVLLARESVAWLLGQGHLVQAGDGRLRLGSKPLKAKVFGQTDKTRREYALGSGREQEWFHSLRRVTPARKALIEASIAELGDLRAYFPVLLDEDGEVVDGRHRLAVDPAWPVDTRRRVSREDRLVVAMAANRVNAWTDKDWARLRKIAEQRHGRQRASAVLARLALLEDSARSDREIARLTGAGHPTVSAVRRDLEENGKLFHFTGQRGRPRKDGTPAQPRPLVLTDELQARVNLAHAAGEVTTEAQVRSRFDLKVATAKTALRRARDEIRRQNPSPPEPASPVPQHQHDWGPWARMRQCADCGEQEIEE